MVSYFDNKLKLAIPCKRIFLQGPIITRLGADRGLVLNNL